MRGRAHGLAVGSIPTCIITWIGSKMTEDMKNIPFMDDDPERHIVSMCKYQDSLYVATQKGIYVLDDEKLRRLEFKANDGH